MRVDKLVPHIRFKGFEEKWSRKRIKDIVNIQAGGDLDKNKLEKNGKYPVIGNTQKNNGILGFLNTYKINAPAVTVTGRGEIGHASFQSIPFTPVVRILALSNKNEKLNMRFLSLAIDNINFFIESTGVPQLTAPQLGVFKVRLPRVEEQKKIGDLFAKLDRLLDLQQQKLDQLELLKKALLQKLFPKQDAKIPELRFKGFAEEWKKEELGSLSDIVRGASPRPIQDKKWFSKDSNIGWLRISDVTEQNGKIYHLEQKLSPLGQEKTRVVKNKHLLLSIAATVGSPVINYIPTGVHDGFLIFLNPQFNIDFMFQWLTYYKNNWAKYGQPGSQVNLNSKIVKNQRIYIPGLNEQQKIGSLFAKVDRLIELENKKFSNLKQVKKSLLQNMFVE